MTSSPAGFQLDLGQRETGRALVAVFGWRRRPSRNHRARARVGEPPRGRHAHRLPGVSHRRGRRRRIHTRRGRRPRDVCNHRSSGRSRPTRPGRRCRRSSHHVGGSPSTSASSNARGGRRRRYRVGRRGGPQRRPAGGGLRFRDAGDRVVENDVSHASVFVGVEDARDRAADLAVVAAAAGRGVGDGSAASPWACGPGRRGRFRPVAGAPRVLRRPAAPKKSRPCAPARRRRRRRPRWPPPCLARRTPAGRGAARRGRTRRRVPCRGLAQRVGVGQAGAAVERRRSEPDNRCPGCGVAARESTPSPRPSWSCTPSRPRTSGGTSGTTSRTTWLSVNGCSGSSRVKPQSMSAKGTTGRPGASPPVVVQPVGGVRPVRGDLHTPRLAPAGRSTRGGGAGDDDETSMADRRRVLLRCSHFSRMDVFLRQSRCRCRCRCRRWCRFPRRSRSRSRLRPVPTPATADAGVRQAEHQRQPQHRVHLVQVAQRGQRPVEQGAAGFRQGSEGGGPGGHGHQADQGDQQPAAPPRHRAHGQADQSDRRDGHRGQDEHRLRDQRIAADAFQRHERRPRRRPAQHLAEVEPTRGHAGGLDER